jgi:hypothetical protein
MTMATDISRLALGALIVRTWRIRLARIVMKIAGGLMTVAERLLPEDLRGDIMAALAPSRPPDPP